MTNDMNLLNMAAIKRIPTEIEFEYKLFDYFSDNDGNPNFDTYILKSKANELIFEVFDNCKVIIYTSKFPTNEWGGGYYIDNRIITKYNETNGKIYASGIGGSRSFKTEFNAQVFIINDILKNCLISTYHSTKMKEKLNKFINPTSLF